MKGETFEENIKIMEEMQMVKELTIFHKLLQENRLLKAQLEEITKLLALSDSYLSLFRYRYGNAPQDFKREVEDLIWKIRKSCEKKMPEPGTEGEQNDPN